MNYKFKNCQKLLSLTDISQWDINNVNDISYMFSGCTSLLSISDISKWKTNNIINMSYLFYLLPKTLIIT